MFVHTSGGVADGRARRGDLGDSGGVVRPRRSANLDLQVAVGVDLLHAAHFAEGLMVNVATNPLVYSICCSLEERRREHYMKDREKEDKAEEYKLHTAIAQTQSRKYNSTE